jgi:2,5-dihydroxypyridine 5,6-dioxygenase
VHAFSNTTLIGARNCVGACGGAQAGMEVLILNLVDDKANPVEEKAVHALAAACQEIGARPQILWATGMEKGWWDDPSRILLGAFGAADLVINNTVIGRPLKAVRELMFEKGVPMVRNMATTVGLLSSDWATFPFELSDEITRRTGELLDSGTSYRVVHPNGTDISGVLGRPSATQSGISTYATTRRKTKNRPFPQGCFSPTTSREANGVIVSDRSIPWESTHLGLPELQWEGPAKLIVENNHIVNIEGGAEARQLRRFFEATERHIGPDAWNISSFHSGIHPKAGMEIAPETSPALWHRGKHNHPSVFHFHLGGSKEVTGYDYQYMWHVSVELDSPTFYIDGEPLLQNGRFAVLDDPKIREMAAAYGDPDDLLTITESPANALRRPPARGVQA